MGEDAGRPAAGGQQTGAERAEAAVRFQILRGDPVRLVLEAGDEVSGRLGARRIQPSLHPIERGPEIDRSRPGVQELGRQAVEPVRRRVGVRTAGEPEDHRVGGSNPDRRSAANDHVADGLSNLAGFGALDPDLLRGEPALVQQSEDPALGVPPERTDHLSTLAACSGTQAAFARRSIPAEPLRFALFCVAFRSKYTGYSSLTRLVSRAPRPHRAGRRSQ